VKKNKEYKVCDKKLDIMIKKSIEAEMNDGKDIITDEELLEMGYTLPPENISQRIMSQRANQGKAEGKRRITVRKILIAVAILGILLSTMSVSGVRVYIFNIVSEIRENSIHLFGTNKNTYQYDADEAKAYEDAEKEFGFSLLKPGYLPEEFVFERIKVYIGDRVVMYYEGNGKTIRLAQRIMIDMLELGDMVDTLEGDIYTFDLGDIEVIASEYERREKGDKWYTAVWYDEKMLYRVDGNCTKEEFEKFIKKLK